MTDNKQFCAPAMLRAAIDQLWDDSTRNRALISADMNGSVNSAFEHLYFDLRLPRLSGKTTAILDEIGPGDMVFCRDAQSTKFFAERINWGYDANRRVRGSMDGTPVAIYAAHEAEYAIREVKNFFSYFTHTIFFDEVPAAREIAGQMTSALYSQNFKHLVEQGYHPRFISLRS